MSTFFACSSGSGRAGIAVWRISGPDAKDIATRVAGRLPRPRQAAYRLFRDSAGEVLDDGLVLYFPGPNSATGDDVVELHCHGSEAVRVRIIETLTKFGASPARPGAFTWRAFENGKMDLLEIEALGDLLNAETEAQRQQAIAIGQGAAGKKLTLWRDKLLDALATLEAAVDFPDEEDVPASIADRAMPILAELRSQILGVAREGAGSRLREGIKIAIVGAPNAGKSSLLNRLLGEERAIVSDIPGTTRDVVSERMILGDRLVHVLDTAGLRDGSTDVIEKIGMARSEAVMSVADIVLWVRDCRERSAALPSAAKGAEIMEVITHIDLAPPSTASGWRISLTTGEGWHAFLGALTRRVIGVSPPSLFPHERQQAILGQAATILGNLGDSPHIPPELLAESVRSCLEAFDQLEGRRTTEAVLDRIFSSFCIGK